MLLSTPQPLWQRRGIQSPVPFDTTEVSLNIKGKWSTPRGRRRRKKIHIQGEFRGCKHYMGSGLGCSADRNVQEHLDAMHPATRAQVKKRKTMLGLFFGDTVSSEDIHSLSFY
jgi:hypothetical protein